MKHPASRQGPSTLDRDLLEAVTGGTDVLLAAVDSDFRYIFFNQAYAGELRRLTGRDIGLGDNMLELFAAMPEQQKVLVAEWSRPLRGETTDKVVEFGEPGTYRRIYRVRHTPLRDAAGLVTGAGEVAYDITEQYKAREAQKDIEYKALLLSQVNDAIAGTDENLRITYWGRGAERMFGYSEAEALGRTPLELLRPKYGPGDRERILGELERDGELRVSISTRHKDGPEIIADVSTKRLTDGSGRCIGNVIVYRDITERAKALAALAEANELLRTQAEELQAQQEELQVQEEELRTQSEETRVQAEEVRQRERTLGGIFNATTESIWLFSTDGIVLMANDMALRRFGKTAPEIIGKRFHEILSPELARTRLARLHETIASRRLVEFDDERAGISFKHSFYPVVDAAGRVTSVACFSRDVTDRNRREEERRRSEDRFRLLSMTASRLLESADPQDVINEMCRGVMAHLDCQVFFNFLADKDSGRLRLNACAGIPEEDVRRLQWLDYGVAVCGAVALNGIRVIAEDIPARPDPRTDLVASFGVKAYACHPLLAQDEVLGTLSFGTKTRTRFSEEDLSLMKTVTDQVAVAIERIRDQQALRERSLELQRLAETLEVRVRQRTKEVEAANERLKAEVAERVRLAAAVAQSADGVAILDAEGRILDVNPAFEVLSGKKRDELLSLSYPQILADHSAGGPWQAARDSLGHGEPWRGRLKRTARDGESLELDVTVSPIHDDAGSLTGFLALEKDVTGDVLMQQHFRQMQKLEALGTLAGGIAHDFNNILNPIFINTELLLLDPGLDDSARQQLELTLRAAERGRDLVKQIITFSRQKELERKPFRAGPVLKEALKFLRASLPAVIEIRADIREERDLVLGDPAQIHQLVMNLCNNAAYSMRDKGGVLSVTLADIDVDQALASRHPGLKTGPYVRLTVADTGTGMTPEVMDRAFDPFFTTKRPGEGAGMGLAVVNGIVRDTGGVIDVASEPGRGSTFTVFLPRASREAPVREAVPNGLPGGSERILFIDDEDMQVQSAVAMLQRLGYLVFTATDSAEALTLFRSVPDGFDLVITDQTMPQITGVKVAQELLKIRPGLPIILCTGFSETVDAAEARALGIREFLMKPYSIREMAETIRRVLAPPETQSP